jgi:hypothetical protein
MQMKKTINTIGNQTAIFRLEAQCLNQLRHCVTFLIKVLLFILI